MNAVVPGLIDTPLTRHRERYAQGVGDLQTKEPEAQLEAEGAKSFAKETMLNVAFIDPTDVAPVVVFLASGSARMVSGTTYDVTASDSVNNVEGFWQTCSTSQTSVAQVGACPPHQTQDCWFRLAWNAA